MPSPIHDLSSGNNQYEQTVNPPGHMSLGVQGDGSHSQKSGHDLQGIRQIPTEDEQRQTESRIIAHENILTVQLRLFPQSLTEVQDEATSSAESSSVLARSELPPFTYGTNDDSSLAMNCGPHSPMSDTPSAQSRPGPVSVASSPISASNTEARDLTTSSLGTLRQSRPSTERFLGSSSENAFDCDRSVSQFSIRKDLVRHQSGHNQAPQMAGWKGASLDGTSAIVYHSSKQHPENCENTYLISEEAAEAKFSLEATLEASERKHDVAVSGPASLSRNDDFDNNKYKVTEASRRSKNVDVAAAGLFPSQESPQSDSDSSFDSKIGLFTRDEPRSLLLDRLMSYFFELFASCDSPVPFPTAPSPFSIRRWTNSGINGPPVNTCEICKPSKIFIRAEHLRRHQLSHQTPQYPCIYPGCDRAFHRADLLARHATRHELEGDKASSRSGTGDNSRRASTTSTGYDEGPQGPMQPSPVISPRQLYSSSYSTCGNNGYSSPSQHHNPPQQHSSSDGGSPWTCSDSNIAGLCQQPPSLDDSLCLSYGSYDTPILNNYDIPWTAPANMPLIIIASGPAQERAVPDLSSDSNPSYPFTPIDNSHLAGYNSSAPPPMTSEWQSSYDHIAPTQGIHSPDMITFQPTFFQDPFYTGIIDPSMSLYSEDSHNACDRGVLGRKRNLQEDDDHDDQERDEGQSGKRARVEGGMKPASRKLACPYFKKDPNYGQLARSCSGPGWDTVHRIKEHLDRNHALPPSCDRCYTTFKTDADRSVHVRSEIQCQLKERPSRMQGFDASQKDKLKGRPKGYKQMSEIHKWCHIYAILFPETEKADIPSPFYNYGSFQDPDHPVDLIVEYDRFLRRRMPGLVRDQLERRIKDTLNPVEETLRGQIVEIVCEVQLELSQLFKSSINPTMHNSYSDPKAKAIEKTRFELQFDGDENNDNREPTSGAADDIQKCLGPEQSSLENVPEVDPPEPFLDTSVRDIDFQLFDFSALVDGPLT